MNIIHFPKLNIQNIYDKLIANTTDANWWECDDPYEIIVGAILTQNTNWNNASKSINILKTKKLLNPHSIKIIDINTLEDLIRPSGFYHQKAVYLKQVTEWYLNANKNRTTLMQVKGVGNETADTILLYGLNQPYFVIDAYTHRIMERIGYPKMSYLVLQQLFMDNLLKDIQIYKIYHGLLVEHAKNICQKKPNCEGCCLSSQCERRGVNGVI